MKLIKLSAMLVLALAMTFAATGCKKKPIGVTKLPGQRVGPPTSGDPRLGTDNTGGIGNTGTDITSQLSDHSVPLPNWDPSTMNQDRSKFAAQTVHFAFDSWVVRTDERVKVEAVAAAMQSEAGLLLLIEGHCDERGTEEYNRSLGEKRALALREELLKAGINADRIQTRSFGEDKPVSTGHDESAWKQNRRGEFIACTPK